MSRFREEADWRRCGRAADRGREEEADEEVIGGRGVGGCGGDEEADWNPAASVPWIDGQAARA